MKVFLGGTCPGWKWRNELQPMLKCDYYNPIVENWSEEDRLREVQERETADYVVYGITASMRGVYSIAEIIDDSNKRPSKTIIIDLYNGSDDKLRHSLTATFNLARENGAMVFNKLKDVAEWLNERIK